MDSSLDYNQEKFDEYDIIANILKHSDIREEMTSEAKDAVRDIYFDNVIINTNYYYEFSFDDPKLVNLDLGASNITNIVAEGNEISFTVRTPATIECLFDIEIYAESEAYSKTINKLEYTTVHYSFEGTIKENNLIIDSISAGISMSVNLGSFDP